MRKPYEASFETLRTLVPIVGEARPRVFRCPREDDDEPGPSIFCETVGDVRLENLTLPGLFVGRARLVRVSFAGARLDGAVLFRRPGWLWRLVRSALPWTAPDQTGVPLSDEQRARVSWSGQPQRPDAGGPVGR